MASVGIRWHICWTSQNSLEHTGMHHSLPSKYHLFIYVYTYQVDDLFLSTELFDPATSTLSETAYRCTPEDIINLETVSFPSDCYSLLSR